MFIDESVRIKGKETIIGPKRGLLEVDLQDLWRYRDLLYMYIKRNFITVYKQTVLGPLWFFIQPIFTIAIYMFIFGGLAGISTEGIPQPLFYMSGIMLWNYFSSAFTESSNVFVQNANIFGKVYFPRLILPLANTASNLIKLGIQFILFLALYFWFWMEGAELQVTWWVLFTPILILMIALHAMSWGMIVSSMTYKYHDLTVLIGFGLQLFMYATPVVYPLETIPEKYRHFVEINPLSSIFEAFKYGWMGAGSMDWLGLLYSFVFMLVTLFLSVIVFNRVERNFMDTV